MQNLQIRQPTKMMNVTIQQRPALDHDEIACLAWQIWQQEGCVPGRDQDNWSKAEQLLLTANHPGKEQTKNVAAKPSFSLTTELKKVLRR
jgi:hypothetical protein